MLRRHLGITRRQARDLPWWEYQVILDGLVEEFGGEGQDEQVQHDASGQATAGSLAELGVNVRSG